MLLQRRPISASDQIPDRFYVISMEFLSLSRRRSSARTSSAAKSEEKRMFSQATMHNRCFVVAGSVNFAMLDFHLQFTNNRGGSYVKTSFQESGHDDDSLGLKECLHHLMVPRRYWNASLSHCFNLINDNNDVMTTQIPRSSLFVWVSLPRTNGKLNFSQNPWKNRHNILLLH